MSECTYSCLIRVPVQKLLSELCNYLWYPYSLLDHVFIEGNHIYVNLNESCRTIIQIDF